MKNSVTVTRLGHVAFGVQELSRAAAFYEDRWGLAVSDEDRASVFLRGAGPDHHIVGLREGEAPGLQHVAWEVAGRDDLELAAERLAAMNVPVLYGPAPADEPGIGHALRFADPDGYLIELYTGNETIEEPYGERAVKPLALNHVVLRVSDLERAERFYTQILGFRSSDWIENIMTFLRCNPNHHSLAFVRSDARTLHHAAFEVRDWQDVARGVYHLGESRVPRVWGPGRHGPGNNVFAYFQDPEENIVEYTYDVAQITDEAAWVPRVWKPGLAVEDQWGQPMPSTMY